ncbi:MAG: Osmotically-inducible protein OsmY, contains domain [Conexibacter sp.]|nr:Osmotically-inducible protein OsmY, contains domain [Conexibacter sp.]
MSDRALHADVRGELARDPRIDEPEVIAVDVDAGFVTLRGVVASRSQRRAILRAARRCVGVIGIGDQLQHP